MEKIKDINAEKYRFSHQYFFTPCWVLLLILFLSEKAMAQERDSDEILWRIETSDGNEFFGKILKRDPNEIVLETENLGVITIQMENVRKMDVITPGQVKAGEVWIENPQATRYFWAPNGYGLKRGEGYYQNVWILFNQVSVGVTDNFTLGLGTVPLFFFAGSATPVWITPKVSIPLKRDKVNLGAGALVGTVIGEESSSFGLAYGVTTIGSKDKNLNIGIGYGFAGGEWSETPTITLSGMLRTGKRGYLISENYWLSIGEDNFILLSMGGRVVWNKISLDYGGFIPAGTYVDQLFIIPWLGFVVPFGR